MTGLVAGYATAMAGFLLAVAAALTIIYNVNRLEIDEQPTREETGRKVAA